LSKIAKLFRYHKHISIQTKNVLLGILLCFAASCSITKKIPEQSQLLTKTKIVCNEKSIDTDDIKNYLKQKPNRKTFFIRFHLRMYYMFEHATSNFGTKMRENAGEPPVLFDEQLHNRSMQQLNLYMHERGYYNAVVTSKIKTKGISDKKIAVKYKIKSGEVYTISNISYNIQDSVLREIILSNTNKSILNNQSPFDISLLKQEQKRITTLINNSGYYSFNESNLYFTADTSKGAKQVHLTLVVKDNGNTTDGTYKKSRIRNIYIYPDFEPSDLNRQTPYDTVIYSNHIYFLYNNKNFLKPDVIQRANYIQLDSLYSISANDKTQRQLIQNKLFKLVTITYKETDLSDSSKLENSLNCYIYITPHTRQLFTVEVEGTNTGGDWGAEINTSYMHKNIARGAENIYFKTKASGEYNRALKTDNEKNQLFNSYEYGGEIGFETPIFLSPIKPSKFDFNYRPKTNFKIAYNYNKTVDYTKPTLQINYGYTWFGNNYLTHILKPIDISYIRIDNPSERLQLYIKNNEYIKYSFEDYMIYSTNYTYIYYNRKPNSLQNYQYIRLFGETAGNALHAIYNAIDTSSQTSSFKTFNVHFAQFAKIEADVRHYQILSKNSMVVYRLFAGMAVPYLNSEGLPSVKKYYAGGANSMRAWANRTLGPGSYIDSTNGFKFYMGDIKLEANIETRFHMFWYLDGAIFIDIGNIWSYNDNTLQGAEFFASKFTKEIAIGTGYGFRFDFSFLILRLDLGLKVKEPYTITNTKSSIIWGNRPLTNEDFNLNIAIGYPF